jgi:hypothetical protein
VTHAQFKEFLHTAVHELMALNAECKHEFSIGSWERWNYDADSGTLTFSDEEGPKVIADVQVVGTTSTASRSWLWGWANESVPPARTAQLALVRKFGEAEFVPILTQPESPDSVDHGWELTGVTAKIIGARGAYRAPRASGGYTYYVYTDIRFADQRRAKIRRELQ